MSDTPTTEAPPGDTPAATPPAGGPPAAPAALANPPPAAPPAAPSVEGVPSATPAPEKPVGREAGLPTPTPANLAAYLDANGAFKPGWAKALGAPEGFEKFSSFEALVKSHANLEKIHGSPNKIVIPGDKATPEEKAAFWNKLGRPEKPEGYELKSPAKIGEKPVPAGFVDPVLLGEFQKTAHSLGLTKEQASKLVEFDTARAFAAQENFQQQITASKEKAVTELKKEWGTNYALQLGLAEKAAKAANFAGNDHPELANHPAFIRAMAALGANLVESPAAAARGNGHIPVSAQQEIATIMGDKTHPYWSKSSPAHDAAVKHVFALRQQASSG